MFVLDRELQKSLKEKYPSEQVLIVPTQSISWLGDKFTPARSNDEVIVLKNLQLESKFIYRSDAEYNPAFQQLIPYCIIRNKNKDKFYMNERISGESRLQNCFSLGFGGHINPVDGRTNAFLSGLKRELSEELYLPKYSTEFIGYTRDLTSKLTDHTGLIYEITTSNMIQTKIKETESMIGRWVTLTDLVDNYYKFEGWARYLIDYYYSLR